MVKWHPNWSGKHKLGDNNQEHFFEVIQSIRPNPKMQAHKWNFKEIPIRCSDCGLYMTETNQEEKTCKQLVMDEALE
jgi:hypothetical protein